MPTCLSYLSLNSVAPFEDSSSSSSSSDSPDERNCEPGWSRIGMPRQGPHRPLLVSDDTMYIFVQRMHSSCGSPGRSNQENETKRETVSILSTELEWLVLRTYLHASSCGRAGCKRGRISCCTVHTSAACHLKMAQREKHMVSNAEQTPIDSHGNSIICRMISTILFDNVQRKYTHCDRLSARLMLLLLLFRTIVTYRCVGKGGSSGWCAWRSLASRCGT